MKTEEFRVKTPAELEEMVIKLRREMMNLRFQRVAGQLQSPAQMRGIRRDIARAKTIMREKSLERVKTQRTK